MSSRPPGKLAALEKELHDLGKVVVAFSGGVDSGLLAWVANSVLGPPSTLCVTAASASLAATELEACRKYARQWGLRLREVHTEEFDNPDYVSNGSDRCYHCKNALMDALEPIAEDEGATVVLGVNLDDLSDVRPGQAAAQQRGAVFPFVRAGIGKEEVRSIAGSLSLDIWDKPSMACLSSRIPHGTPIEVGMLSQVARAEKALKTLGLRQVRVRHHGEIARLEIGADELPAAMYMRMEILHAVYGVGFKYVVLDLEGYRTGGGMW
ncbi:MAG: ATP-dependent sacrificial sulfur transferase LarE [Actinobacteria bacterium]|nr:ATP-dependent sacrificial sulfur transferase LarE [Actinomycetota bacterium]MCL5445902.1 ATP-dependent sacrificial sulfur transferase LarE [Actinomycetota bacterium]